MESAPLSLAYSHARNAASEQQKSNAIAASEEHDLAAGEFSNAAKSTGDPEALRTLQLLEQYHQRLAELLKFKPEPHPTLDLVEEEVETEEAKVTARDGVRNEVPQKSGPAKQASKASSHRELSSSIKSNLASARGIHPKQKARGESSIILNTTNADGRMVKESDTTTEAGSSRRMLRGHDRRPPPAALSSIAESSAGAVPRAYDASSQGQIPQSVLQAGTDDAFTRFYSTVETLGTKLSAALAFTGLPLTNSEADGTQAGSHAGGEKHSAQQTNPSAKVPPMPRDKSRTTPAGSPDVSRFFSRAALKAVRDETGPGVAESFYVVPTSGGTVSYRDMLSATGQHSRQGSNLSNVDEEEFVDAQEVPVTGSFEGVRSTRNARNKGSAKTRPAAAGDRAQQDMMNELTHWKALAMETGERLRAFEMNAQRESIMHASMFRHASRPGSPTVTKKAGGNGMAEARIQELEQRLIEIQAVAEREGQEVRRLTKENKRLDATLEKYKKKFDELRDSARQRLKREDEGKSTQSSAAVTSND